MTPSRIVRNDPAVVLGNLFRLLPRCPDRPKLDRLYEGEGGRLQLHFRGPDALGIPEQTLLFALCELAQERFDGSGDVARRCANDDEPGTPALLEQLHRGKPGPRPPTLTLVTSWHELGRRTGASPGGSRTGQLRKQLRRLCECTVWERRLVEDGGWVERQAYLVAMVESDDKRLHVALNVRLADAICGAARYMPISMAERLQLSTSVARALHAFFSGWIRAGEGQRIGLDTLVERLWWPGDAATARPSGTARRQRHEVREALKELAKLECWEVAYVSQTLVRVRRRGAWADGRASGPSGARRVREKTCPLPNRDLAKGEREDFPEAASGNAFEPVDASALFSPNN